MPEPINGTDVYTYKYLANPLAKKICFVNPNTITILNMLLTPVIMYGILYNWDTQTMVLLVLLRQFNDCLDGAVARKCNKSSKLGADLDKYGDYIFFICMNLTILYMLFKNDNLYKYHAIIIILLYTILDINNSHFLINIIHPVVAENYVLSGGIITYLIKMMI